MKAFDYAFTNPMVSVLATLTDENMDKIHAMVREEVLKALHPEQPSGILLAGEDFAPLLWCPLCGKLVDDGRGFTWLSIDNLQGVPTKPHPDLFCICGEKP